MRHCSWIFIGVCSLGLLGTKDASAKDTGRVMRKVTSKVFFSKSKLVWVPSIKTLKQELAKGGTTAEVSSVGRDRWSTTMVAFFKRKSYPGPITVWFYDKADTSPKRSRDPVHIATIETKPKQTLVEPINLYGADGFNKGRTYDVYVGQLLGRRQKVFAKGEIKLLP